MYKRKKVMQETARKRFRLRAVSWNAIAYSTDIVIRYLKVSTTKSYGISKKVTGLNNLIQFCFTSLRVKFKPLV